MLPFGAHNLKKIINNIFLGFWKYILFWLFYIQFCQLYM